MQVISQSFWFCVIVAWGMVGNVQAVQNQPDSSTDVEFEEIVSPFLRQYCLSCHGEPSTSSKTALPDFRLDNLSSDIQQNRDAWHEVVGRLRGGEMPPSEFTPQPTANQAAAVADWLTERLNQIEAMRSAQQEPVSFYRLSRQEYANTINDLLGVAFHVDDAGPLNEDDDWHGFKRIGSALTVSASHLEQYLDAASMILDEAFPDNQPRHVDLSLDALALAGGAGTFGKDKLDALRNSIGEAKPRLDLWPGQSARVGPNVFQDGGVYRFQIQVSGLQSVDGRTPHMAIYAQNLDRLLFEQELITVENEPVEIGFDVHLPPGRHQFELTNEVVGPAMLARLGRTADPFFSIKDGYLPWQLPLLDSSGRPNYPCLIVDNIRIEGPFLSAEASSKRQRYWPDIETDRDRIDKCLIQFAESAFRRPVTRTEVNPYAKLVHHEMESGEPPKRAIKTGMLAMLVSRNFLYLVEGLASPRARNLTDFELASRLSYFLWSSMPDDELFELARNNTLHQTDVLKQQVKRMLADDRSARFVWDFSRQWLQLDRIGMFKPDARLYPEYDAYLQRSMIDETTLFFEQVLRQNLTLREFIDSDWTVLNPRLARHYGIDMGTEVEPGEFEKVALQPDDRRGGILTQASILSLTSDGARHRPVHRGVWLSEVILGRTIPSPPANVEPLEPDLVDQSKSTVRMKLENHVANPNCSVCHQKIDPLGFAFDNYDAIGRWRDLEEVPVGIGANPDVNASGELPDGRTFAGAAEFQSLLLDDIKSFNAAFVQKLATYALRRPVSINDEPALSKIAQLSMLNNYRLQDLIEEVVLSELFRQRQVQ